MDAIEELRVSQRNEVLKREIEQTLEEAFAFGQIGCVQNVRSFRHNYPPPK
jgi:hypothetical protein